MTIHKFKERWNLYFVILTEHPTENDMMVMRIFPENPIRLTPKSDNHMNFVPDGQIANGLIVLERELPVDQTVRAQVYLRHSNDLTRSIGQVMQEIEEKLGDSVIGTIADIFNIAGPWVVVSRAAFGIVADILRKVTDKDFGYLSLDQHFTEEFKDNTELDRKQHFSTQEASLVWTWSVDR